MSSAVVRLSRSVVSQKPYFIRRRLQSDYGDECMRSLDTLINPNVTGKWLSKSTNFLSKTVDPTSIRPACDIEGVYLFTGNE
jgi:hypothetical protein